jgi:serine/threonine-protein kinase
MPEQFRRDYLVRLPLPLAQLYRRAFNAKDARGRHDNTFYLFEALVKLAAAPLAAAYVRDLRAGGTRIEALDRLLAHLALPSLGQWVAMLRELARHFGGRPGPLAHLWQQLDAQRRDLPAVLALYRRIKNGPDGQQAGDRSCSLLQLLDALVQYRNSVFGHGAGRFEAFYGQEMGPLLFPAANAVLAEHVLDPLGPPGSRLVTLTEVRTVDEDRVEVGVRELVGLEGERAVPLALSKAQAAALLPNRVAVLRPDDPVPLRLDPLLVYRESETTDDLLFLNRDRNGRQVEYLSYTTGRTEQDRTTAPALAALLELVVNRPVGEVELRELAERSRLETPPSEAATAAPDAGALQIRLEVTEGPHRGQAFTFAGHDTFLVGRSSRAHFRTPAKDEYFSRIHFMVEVNPPQCRLTDMGSKNGTYVNGRKAGSADLKDGDLIKAGTTVLRVSLTVGEGAPEPPALAPAACLVTPTALPQPPAAPGLVVAPGVCPVCAAPLAMAGAKPAPALCSACEAEAQGKAQPIKGYQIVRELGRGGMGVVYLALRMAHRTPVALKTITPAVAGVRAHVERFLREADILRRLAHPNIVACRDTGESAGQLYFAMDYVRGTDAARLLQEEGPLPVGRGVGLVCQLLEALAYAHAQGFVHRDVKPANVLVEAGEAREVVRLADFGLARVYQASPLSGLTMRGDVGGTVAFMAPEQVTQFREAQPPVDQYAAGATLYTLLTDRHIYDLPEQFTDQILMLLQEDPVPIRARRPDLPAELAGVIHRALAREPGSRFADVGAMRQALLAFC